MKLMKLFSGFLHERIYIEKPVIYIHILHCFIWDSLNTTTGLLKDDEGRIQKI